MKYSFYYHKNVVDILDNSYEKIISIDADIFEQFCRNKEYIGNYIILNDYDIMYMKLME